MKDLKTIDLNLLPIETLKEMANEAGEQVENNAKLTVQKAADCGRYLTAIKEQCEPGTWLEWLGANWNYSRRTASRYMEIAEHGTRMSHLKDASSINEALRMIADDKEEKTALRSERKPASVVVTKPDDSTRVLDDPGEPDADQVDDDPTPNPPTNRKTAKGSEKVSEDKKPRTATITPEILPDEPETLPEEKTLADWSLAEILNFIADIAEGDAKGTAKQLRKLADKLDPPDESPKPETVPTIAKLIKAIPDEVGSLRSVIEKWARHKQSLQGKARVRSMESWETMIEQMLKACDRHGVSEVSESIRSSMANNYTGWDIELKKTNGSNGNGKAQHNGRGRGLTADEVFS